MPYHMHLFGMSALEDGTPLAQPRYWRGLRHKVLRFLGWQKSAGRRRRRGSFRTQGLERDDILTIYPPALADLKRRGGGKAG